MKRSFILILTLITISSTACSPVPTVESCKASERKIPETSNFKPLWSESNVFAVYSNPLDPSLNGLNSTVFAVVHRDNNISSEIVALDTQSGKLKWQQNVTSLVTIVTSDTALYMGSYDHIQEYNPQTGKVVSGTNVPKVGNIYNLFVNNQTLYAFSTSGRWLMYNLKDHTLDSSEPFPPYTPFMMDKGILYLDDSEGIKATKTQSGETLWRYSINEPINSHPLFIDDKMIILSITGNIYTLDKENGNLIWKSEAKVLSNITADTSYVSFLTVDGYLKVLNLSDGQELQSLKISSTPFEVISPTVAIGTYNIWMDSQNQTVVFSLGDSCQLIALKIEN